MHDCGESKSKSAAGKPVEGPCSCFSNTKGSRARKREGRKAGLAGYRAYPNLKPGIWLRSALDYGLCVQVKRERQDFASVVAGRRRRVYKQRHWSACFGCEIVFSGEQIPDHDGRGEGTCEPGFFWHRPHTGKGSDFGPTQHGRHDLFWRTDAQDREKHLHRPTLSVSKSRCAD